MKVAVYTHHFANLIGTIEHRGDGVLRLKPGNKDSSAYLDRMVDDFYRPDDTPDAFLQELGRRSGLPTENVPDGEPPQLGFNDAPGDQIPGGLADGKTDADFPAGAVEKGARVEREHTASDSLAREIARDHLAETPRYYDRLEKARLAHDGKTRVLGRRK